MTMTSLLIWAAAACVKRAGTSRPRLCGLTLTSRLRRLALLLIALPTRTARIRCGARIAIALIVVRQGRRRRRKHRQLADRNRFARDLFDVFQQTGFFWRYERNRDAGGARSAGSTDAMNVVFRHIR